MKKKMYKSGNAWALLIQKAILELLDIDPENDEVELEVENKVLKVKKAQGFCWARMPNNAYTP